MSAGVHGGTKTLKLRTFDTRYAVILLISASLVTFLPVHGLQFEASKESDHFKIFLHTGYEQQASLLLKAHEDCYTPVTDFIGYKPPSKIEIYLCATPEEISKDFGYPTKPAVDASCGQFHRGVLSYYNPKELVQTGGALATHEVTHAVERQFLTFRCPFWWTEGIACYLTYKIGGKTSPGGLYRDQLQVLSDSILRNSPPFRTLQDLVSPPADTLSYITSMTVFSYLNESYSESKIKELILSARNAQDVYLAFQTTLGKGFDKFEAEWKNCLTEGAEAIADTQAAVQAAELEHRTQGLDEAKTKLSEAIDAFNVGKFGEASATANEASVLARSSTEPSASFEYSNLSIRPGEVLVGEPVAISVNVRNTGAAWGETALALKINGVVVENRTVSLPPAETRTIAFAVTEKAEGAYNVKIAELTGSFTARSVSPFPTPLVVVALAVAVPAYVLLRRVRRKRWDVRQEGTSGIS